MTARKPADYRLVVLCGADGSACVQLDRATGARFVTVLIRHDLTPKEAARLATWLVKATAWCNAGKISK